MFAEMFQFEQSSVSELQFSNMLCAVVVFEKSISPKSMLGYPADSDRRPDIVIDGQPWEVKATGLIEVSRGGWRAKEPMSITAVAPEGIVAESFTTSAFWHKAERLLDIYYLYVRPGRGVAVEYADMSVEELIGLGENEAEDRELVVWLNGYMDPYEGVMDTAKYARAEIIDRLFSN